ncbi:hypothetical protein [Paenibacillus odorifer]|uniref:hypothetical protein n=1 Tax=Paenibacillus odorifer TaxID=189426 RepID=UPI00096C1646|nr:hypothetical protein [Paenibacillus odorifer]OMD67612.1 hypothetical protein BSK50_30040 [Paenibacillus odorifer]
MNQLLETSLFYAAESTERLTKRSNTIHNERLFKTELEAMASGLEYNTATWSDLNMLAELGHHYPDSIICTPQGRFLWVDIYELDELSEEMELTNCVYRCYGAPDSFSEELEEYFFWNEDSELMRILEKEGKFKALIKDQNGEVVVIES